MSDPTTPTGKRLAKTPGWPHEYDGDIHAVQCRGCGPDIIAIEQEAAAAALERSIQHDIEVKAERNAAQADADRLAEVVRDTALVKEYDGCCWCGDGWRNRNTAHAPYCVNAREALDLHDAAKEAERE